MPSSFSGKKTFQKEASTFKHYIYEQNYVNIRSPKDFILTQYSSVNADPKN